jgi:hypothetical protein
VIKLHKDLSHMSLNHSVELSEYYIKPFSFSDEHCVYFVVLICLRTLFTSRFVALIKIIDVSA